MLCQSWHPPDPDLLSPNHVEALSLCSIATPSDHELKEAVEKACLHLATLRPKQATIVRAGALGSCYVSADKPDVVHWTPAYWQGQTDRIVDPTGAGNGFMGALSAALDEGLGLQQGERFIARRTCCAKVHSGALGNGRREFHHRASWASCNGGRKVERRIGARSSTRARKSPLVRRADPSLQTVMFQVLPQDRNDQEQRCIV